MMNSEFEVKEHSGINPEKESAKIVAQHQSAYAFMRPFVEGRLALEIGHGDGYGSAYLSDVAREMSAVDLFEENVVRASQKYPRKNLRFFQMNATNLTFPDNAFDVVSSFQVIEHIPEAQLPQYINQIKRVLKSDGMCFLSTLNLKKNMKPGVAYDKSPHHDKEFTPEEYRDFLSPYFKKVTLYGLYPTSKLWFFERLKKSGLFSFLPKETNPVGRFYSKISVSDFRWLKKTNLDDCIDLLACCQK